MQAKANVHAEAVGHLLSSHEIPKPVIWIVAPCRPRLHPEQSDNRQITDEVQGSLLRGQAITSCHTSWCTHHAMTIPVLQTFSQRLMHRRILLTKAIIWLSTAPQGKQEFKMCARFSAVRVKTSGSGSGSELSEQHRSSMPIAGVTTQLCTYSMIRVIIREVQDRDDNLTCLYF